MKSRFLSLFFIQPGFNSIQFLHYTQSGWQGQTATYGCRISVGKISEHLSRHCRLHALEASCQSLNLHICLSDLSGQIVSSTTQGWTVETILPNVPAKTKLTKQPICLKQQNDPKTWKKITTSPWQSNHVRRPLPTAGGARQRSNYTQQVVHAASVKVPTQKQKCLASLNKGKEKAIKLHEQGASKQEAEEEEEEKEEEEDEAITHGKQQVVHAASVKVPAQKQKRQASL